MLGRDKEDVVGAAVGDLEARDIERLCVNVPIDLERSDFAERRAAHVPRRERRLVRRRAGSRVPVLRRSDLRGCGLSAEQRRHHRQLD